MPNVQGRNVENKIFINYAVCKFLSRIILKKLNVDSLTTFRKVEKILKKIIKIKADIKYLKDFCGGQFCCRDIDTILNLKSQIKI